MQTVNYVGERAHHEQFAEKLAKTAVEHVVLIDGGCEDLVPRFREVRTTRPGASIFLLACREDEVAPEDWAALRSTVQGVLRCDASPRVLTAGDAIAPLLPRLTQDQINVVACAAGGLSIEATAAALDVPVRVAQSALDSACTRLGARNRAHAVALAIRHGYDLG
ncbi:hypothetical protein FPZ12_005895 [Amycolatopsis acidicola]|uniref:HTH luxR-type domain-containing protein n=1 Tax=Amycolatopsis acidicola TaxID=2596893 RepID=A0A5N0VH92_9PSEU|nr:hypothetical protein [Amycolatopsis acidicola]KAA9165596.1 hypothetical protein FPZ12_005895 [Amycolatopsis acidicola]